MNTEGILMHRKSLAHGDKHFDVISESQTWVISVMPLILSEETNLRNITLSSNALVIQPSYACVKCFKDKSINIIWNPLKSISLTHQSLSHSFKPDRNALTPKIKISIM